MWEEFGSGSSGLVPCYRKSTVINSLHASESNRDQQATGTLLCWLVVYDERFIF